MTRCSFSIGVCSHRNLSRQQGVNDSWPRFPYANLLDSFSSLFPALSCLRLPEKWAFTSLLPPTNRPSNRQRFEGRTPNRSTLHWLPAFAVPPCSRVRRPPRKLVCRTPLLAFAPPHR